MSDTFTAKLRIPTDSYAYIEVDYTGTKEQIVLAYHEFMEEYRSSVNGEGLVKKEFDQALDRYLCTGKMSAEAYEGMNKEQKAVIQTIKRGIKRITRNNDVHGHPILMGEDETPVEGTPEETPTETEEEA